MMKKIKKFLAGKTIANWVWLVLLVMIVLSALFGWRITYNPQLESSWDAISAVGNWVSVVISGVAIWFAVSVPKKIAEEQNKIALFEKRFESYSVFLKYISFANSISHTSDWAQLQKAFLFNFIGDKIEFDSEKLIHIIKRDENMMMSGLFLFSDFCPGTTIESMIKKALDIVCMVQYEQRSLSNDDINQIKLFCNECKKFDEKYMKVMRRQILTN